MAYANRHRKSKGKIGNNRLVNEIVKTAIQSKMEYDYSNSSDFNSDAYRKKLGLILSIING